MKMLFVENVSGVTMFDNVEYIILHRDISETRERSVNLLLTIDHIKRISNNISVKVIEQSEEATKDLKEILLENGIVYDFIYNPNLFNRSWGFNFAAVTSNKTKLVFGDNDMLIEKSSFIESVRLLDGYSFVRPYNGFSNDLTPEQLEIYKNSREISSGSLRNIGNFSGGVMMANRQDFINIGMFDERFEGWGGEDDEMANNLRIHESMGNIKTISFGGPVTHLYHSRANVNDGPTQSNYHRNVSYIHDRNRNDGIQKLGDRNKYVKS